ncbi:MAG TPA: hypothetical protein DEA90_10380 [Opitutae bacterium]|nr:hypothetical protein [Puniceicoccaceae bacterium]HBR94558.1 hypothetical protein [Opitutae bacterium]|tara:strand:+ start:7880 stop:8422 length:543 start_codon:yes stop_codon:yes gene_type:complete
MDDFDSFKASREKMDPSARKMSERQWQQAYVAYRNTRERVVSAGERSSEARSGASSKKRLRSGSSGKSAGRGAHQPSSASELAQLRHLVREKSAYADLRLIIDILAWVAIAVALVAGVLTLLFYTSVLTALVSVLSIAMQVICIVVVRLLVQVLIDIPDIGLYRLQRERAEHAELLQSSE